MINFKLLLLVVVSLSLFSCNSPTNNTSVPNEIIKPGVWRVTMTLPDAVLPFNMQVESNDSSFQLVVINDIEMITVDDVTLKGDSFFISMPVFQSELIGKIESDTLMVGNWHNYAKGPDYLIPFKAKFGNTQRFTSTISESNLPNVSGKWEVTFSELDEKPCKAIGLFKQENNIVTGTFITETGDYRFLEGTINKDSLFLSCFDGSHAFLFKSKVSDSAITGRFWSGSHWQESWIAKRNESFELSSPDSLTFLNEGYDRLTFSFPNLDSTLVSLTDEKYQNKVVVVQIMGSWCPNCADEVAVLKEMYDKYNEEGLEVIALAYEKTIDFENAVKVVSKMKNYYSANYEFLIAGKANKIEAQKTLPMLNHIMSYPTCIFIDRDMNIRKIRTGFYGPSAGKYHKKFVKEVDDFVVQLLHNDPI